MNDKMYEWKSLETTRIDHELHNIKLFKHYLPANTNQEFIKFVITFCLFSSMMTLSRNHLNKHQTMLMFVL